MPEQHDFHNILAIHFGQLGDVVLGLPALRAIRERFPSAMLTVMTGKPPALLVRLAEIADDLIEVDRVELRDGNRLRSLVTIVRLFRDVRRRRFDLSIDLNSLAETNLLTFAARIPMRLSARRGGRRLTRLANFPISPPAYDRSHHAAVRYLDVLKPLGIEGEPVVEIVPPAETLAEIKEIFRQHGLDSGKVVGMFPGAGAPDRRWPIEKVAGLARRLIDELGVATVVFTGPEEGDLRSAIDREFPSETVILDGLNVPELLCAITVLDVFVTNDTGPAHLAAATPVRIVRVAGHHSPDDFMPLSERLISVTTGGPIDGIEVDDVFQAVRASLEMTRT